MVRVGVVLFVVGSVFAAPEPSKPPVPEDEIVTRYVDARLQQLSALRGGSMEVDIDSNVPKLKKHGKLHALRSISKLGKITYHMLGFSGDNFVKTEVIARYLAEEVKAAQDGKSPAVTPENYKFKYKGTDWIDGHDAYVLHVSPKQKKLNLFKGDLWLDAATYLPLREVGSLVKTPVGVKHAQFVHTYEIQNGISMPKRWENRADIRFVGTVELNIDYLGFSKEADAEAGVQQ
jgi:hypothetical protein